MTENDPVQQVVGWGVILAGAAWLGDVLNRNFVKVEVASAGILTILAVAALAFWSAR